MALMALTSLRWRGLAALVGGVVLLMAVPLYQALVLAPAGYLEATARIGSGQQFGPYLAWAAAHAGIDTGYRLVEIVPFALALAVPGALRRLLWADAAPRGRVVEALGLAGFALFAAAIALAAVMAPHTAGQYAAQPAARAAIARGYTSLYAFETLVTNVLAGGLIASFLLLTSLRGSATGRMPGWLAYIGLATGGLLGATAVLFLFALTQTETPTASLAILGLALWLMAIGLLLLRVRVRQDTAGNAATDVANHAGAEPPAESG
jgi:hypothetical protein